MERRPDEVTIDEARDLATAMAHWNLIKLGIRALTIKGPMLAADGLRAPRTSADVDLLIEPLGFADALERLEELGWARRPEDFVTSLKDMHSVSLYKDGWPCDIDVHKRYPGFLAPVDKVFDSLWRQRRSVKVANQPTHVPSRITGALILALHSLRSTDEQRRHREEYESVLAATFSDEERAELCRAAQELGCVLPLQGFFDSLGLSPAASDLERESPDLAVWERRVAAGAHGSYLWLETIRSVGASQRLRLIAHAVWPPRAELLTNHYLANPTPLRVLRLRVSRLGRGVRTLPRAVRAFRLR